MFTGRSEELKRVFQLLLGRERKRILVYGWVGIGKTAFLLEVLAVLRCKSKDTLTAYISLPPQTDLATAALIALAQEMKSDQWAQELLNQMGLIPKKELRKTKTKLEGKIGVLVEVEKKKSSPLPPCNFPLSAFKTC